MHVISQRRKKRDEEEDTKHLTQKLSAIFALGRNQVVARKHSALFEKMNPENTTRTKMYDGSGLKNTFKGVSLLAQLHSKSLTNHFQPNIRQRKEGYREENGLTSTRDENAESQKQNNLMDDRHNSTRKQHLSMKDISKNNFILKMEKLKNPGKSWNGVVRRNPRNSYMDDPFSLDQVQDEFEARLNSEIGDEIQKELKAYGTMNVRSSKFTNSSDFRGTQKSNIESRQRRDPAVLGKEVKKVLLEKKQPVLLNTSAEDYNLATSIFERSKIESRQRRDPAVVGKESKQRIYHVFDVKKIPTDNHSEKQLFVSKTRKLNKSNNGFFPSGENVTNENPDLKIRESQIEIDQNDSGIVDDCDENDIREVSIIHNGHEEKIIYASKSIDEEEEEEEKEPEISEPNLEQNVQEIDFKKVISPSIVNGSKDKNDKNVPKELKKIVTDVTSSAKAFGTLSGFYPILIFLSSKSN
ncbi:hypothetical protein LOAG_08886 [Loa loa]|uniref:Uncharacterized protein n=1 Tax=Loa loa TaxID=7209 RepID=A0A1S0TSX2_LOALO|nr:hypothetical protein LOAG_08886 [Loa loa]EFO19604.2 hypothetical protein LOAG_08886 [Loa loa]